MRLWEPVRILIRMLEGDSGLRGILDSVDFWYAQVKAPGRLVWIGVFGVGFWCFGWGFL